MLSANESGRASVLVRGAIIMTKDAFGSFTVEQLASLVRERFGAAVHDDVGAVACALAELIDEGRAEHTQAWVDDAELAAHALFHAEGIDADPRAVIESLRGGDLVLALACARGVDGALRYFEREHLVHVRSFVSRIDPSPSFADDTERRRAEASHRERKKTSGPRCTRPCSRVIRAPAW